MVVAHAAALGQPAGKESDVQQAHVSAKAPATAARSQHGMLASFVCLPASYACQLALAKSISFSTRYDVLLSISSLVSTVAIDIPRRKSGSNSTSHDRMETKQYDLLRSSAGAWP